MIEKKDEVTQEMLDYWQKSKEEIINVLPQTPWIMPGDPRIPEILAKTKKP